MDIFTLFGTIAIKTRDASDRLRRFEREGEEAARNLQERFDRMADNVANSLERIGQAGTGIMAGLAVAGAGVVALALPAASAEDAMYKLQAQLGATDEETKQLMETAKNVYKKGYGESIGEVANDLALLKQQLGEVDQATLESAQAVKGAFDLDTKELGKVSTVMKQVWGQDAKQTIDMVAWGMQNGLNYADDLVDTMWEYSTYFKKMGMDQGQMMAVLKAGKDAGAFNLDKVGDAFKEFGIRSKDLSKNTMEAFASLGFNADELSKKFAQGGESAVEAQKMVFKALLSLQDPLKKNTIGVQLFGTQWEDMEAGVMDNVMKAAIDSKNTLENMKFDGIAQKAGDDMHKSLSSKLKIIKREFEMFFADEGNPLLQSLHQLVDYVIKNMPQIKQTIQDVLVPIINGIRSLVEWFLGLSPAMQGAIVKFGLLAAVLLPMMPMLAGLVRMGAGVVRFFMGFSGIITKTAGVLGKVTGGVSKVFGALAGGAGAVRGFGGIFGVVLKGIFSAATKFLGPIGWIIGGLITNFGGIVDAVKNLFSIFVNAGGDVIAGFKQGFGEGMKALGKFVWEAFKGIINLVLNLFGIASPSKVFAQIGGWVTEGFLNGFKSIIEGAANIIKNLVSTMVSGIKNAIGWVTDAAKGLVNGIGNVLGGAVDIAKNVASGIGNAITNGLNSAKTAVSNAVSWAGEKINAIGNAAKDAGNWAKDKAVDAGNWLGNKFNQAKDWVSSKIPKMAEGGVLNSAQHVIAGEAGPEAIIPLKDGVLAAIGRGIARTLNLSENPMTGMATQLANVLTKVVPSSAMQATQPQTIVREKGVTMPGAQIVIQVQQLQTKDDIQRMRNNLQTAVSEDLFSRAIRSL